MFASQKMASGSDERVEVFPLPELSVDLGGPERGWNKLAVFAETLYDLKGKVLCLDLDLLLPAVWMICLITRAK